MQTHQPRNKSCPACGRANFRSVSGVTIHVESGYCKGCGNQGPRLVRDFMKKNMPQCYQPALCDGEVSEEDDDPYCRSCDRFFKSMGALLQHMEAKHRGHVGAPKLSLDFY
eukprot:Skav230164  [mRNA]  locus=scaffold996:135293:135625:- [translate_table: standard]